MAAAESILASKQVLPLTEEEKKKVTAPVELWDDSFALKIAKQDFETAETYRQQAHDQRFRTADALYLAWVNQRYWPGTKQPRSSLGVWVALSQVESLLPIVVSSIFSDPQWFECTPRPGTEREEGRSVSQLIDWQTEEIGIREVFRRGIKSAAIYGNGPMELSWKAEDIEKWRTFQDFEMVNQKVQSIFFGQQERPVSKKRVFRMQKYTERINMPTLKNISIKDFYIDPNCASPITQEARYACVRKMMTIDELLALKKNPGFSIPDKEVLLALAKSKPTTYGDQSKAGIDSLQGSAWNPQIDSTADPSGQRIEVIIYTTKDRIVWMGNRLFTLFNNPNPLGMINYFSFWYIDVPDSWHALGVCDVIEGDQRFQERLINGRIDELALSLHPSTIKRRGVNIPSSQLVRRPGNSIEVNDPAADIVREEVSNITQQAFLEQTYSELRVQRTTGLTDIAAMGAPTSGGNSANRTATGINRQAATVASRLNYLVENCESTVVEPMLYAWQSLNQRFLDPEQVINLPGIKIDPMDVKNAYVKFSLRASARMQSRQQLMQVYPLVAQTFLNPAFLEMLARTYGMKVNILEIGQMLEDMSGYRLKSGGSLFEPLSDEEKQMLNQPAPADQLRMMMQRERIQGQSEIAQEKHAADIMEMVGKHMLEGASDEGEGRGEGEE